MGCETWPGLRALALLVVLLGAAVVHPAVARADDGTATGRRMAGLSASIRPLASSTVFDAVAKTWIEADVATDDWTPHDEAAGRRRSFVRVRRRARHEYRASFVAEARFDIQRK